MNNNLKIEMVIAAIILLIIIIICLKKNSISIKTSILWMLLPIIFILMVIFADPLIDIAHAMGFENLSNLIFVATIGLLLILVFALTIIISTQQRQITKLVQELAILKQKRKK